MRKQDLVVRGDGTSGVILGMTPGEHHIAVDSRRALYPRLVVAAIIQTGVVWTQWGNGARVTQLGLVFVAYAIVTRALSRFWDRETAAVATAKFLSNVVLTLLAGHLSSWSFPAFLYLPFHALARDSANYRVLRLSYLGLMTATGIVAVFEHGSLVALVTCALMALATYASAERRLRFTQRIVDDLAERNAELTRARADLEAMTVHAIEQEKLGALGMLAAGVAHEINNPMSFVRANVEMLYEELSGRAELDEELAEYVSEMLPATLEGIRRVNVIVGDLQRFARGDPEGMIPYDLNEQVETAIRIMQPKLRERCELVLDLATLPKARGLPQQLMQMIMNLLDNAVEAQADQPQTKVGVSTAVDGDHIVLFVADAGRGIAPEIRAKLFEPFFTTKGVGQGTGLGLSVAYGIVKTHAGSIDVDSTPGHGSIFKVRLPIEPAPAKLAAARIANAA